VLFSGSGEFEGTIATGTSEDARVSPDGRYLAFAERLSTDPGMSSSRPLLMDMCTGERTPIGPAGRIYGLSWDGSSTEVAVGIDGEVYLAPIHEGVARQVTNCRPMGEGAMCAHPELSPDGNSVAYSLGFGNPDGDSRTGIYVIETTCLWDEYACGSAATPILRPPGAVTWSPDSRQLALANGAAIEVYEVPSGALVRVLPRESSSARTAIKWVAWPPVGNEIVAVAPGGELRLIDVSTGEVRIVVLAPPPPIGLAGVIVADPGHGAICPE
jgi:WD40 repeat protein